MCLFNSFKNIKYKFKFRYYKLICKGTSVYSAYTGLSNKAISLLKLKKKKKDLQRGMLTKLASIVHIPKI